MGTKQTQNCVGGTKFNFKDWGYAKNGHYTAHRAVVRSVSSY